MSGMKASVVNGAGHAKARSDESINTADLGLDRAALLDVYRVMVRSRRLDDKEIQLKNQSRAFFQISGAGHEAVLVAAGLTLKPGYDWFHAYYRDRALCLQLGVTPLEMLLAAVGAAADPSNAGRQMPSHWGHNALNIVPGSSATATQVLHAVGGAEAGVVYQRVEDIADRESRFQQDEIVYTSLGEGATSEGEFWESLNTACTKRLPVLYLIEDNGYAISVPVEVQTPGGDVSRLLAPFPGLHVASVDGTDFFASLRVLREAVAYVRARKGPAVVHARVIRPYSHSLSDDEKLYKTPQEREAEARRDPITRFAEFLRHNGLATAAEIESIHTEVQREIDEAAIEALRAPRPARETAADFVYSPDVDPASDAFRTAAEPEGKPDTMVAAINRTLKDEMAHDPRIVVFGEDIADASRREALAVVRGKGGVFKVTHGLQRAFGDDRVFNAPIAEANIIGRGGRHGDPRTQAGRRDPVLRLHLAGDDAAAQRDGDAALPERQPLVLSDGHPRPDRRLPARRRTVSQPVGREHLRALPGHPHRLSVERRRRGRTAPHRDPLRRSGDVPGAQAPLPPDLQQGRVPRQELHGAVRRRGDPPRGRRRARRHLGCGRPAGARRRAPGGEAGRAGDGARSADDRPLRLGGDRRPRQAS